MEHTNPDDGRLNILQHLREPDSFLAVVVMAGAALILIIVAALIVLVATGSDLVPKGYTRAAASTQIVWPSAALRG